MIATCDNVCSEAARGANPERPLTHLSELTGRGLAVKATRTCSIDGCDQKHKGHGYCKLHLQRVWRQGDPNKVGVPARPSGPNHPHWSGDRVTYRGAHLRVRYRRGTASNYLCSSGTCASQAAHWAYDNADPNELKHVDGRRYSADPSHYKPLCVRCHSQFDASARSVS